MRKIWNVPPTTHGNILYRLCDKPCIDAQILCRYLQFYFKAIKSNNVYISLCAKLCQHSNTPAAGNLRLLLQKLNMDVNVANEYNLADLKKRLFTSFAFDNECLAIGAVARELCLVRDGLLETPFSRDDINMMLHDICTN